MLAYTKVLKQNGNFHFDLMPITGASDLRVAIKSFFDDHESGVHAAIVCTDNPNVVMDEEDFRTALSRGDAWSVNFLFADGSELADADCVCARRGPFEFIGRALADVLKCAKQVIGEYDNSDNSLISALITFEELRKLPLKDLWSYSNAVDSSAILNSIVSHQTVPDIRILLLLPQRHFETFSNPECYFPKFLEYVVLGEDVIAIFCENQKLKEKLQQLEENYQQLTKENQAYRQAQVVLEQITQLYKEVYQQSSELLIQFQKIDTHDRFGVKPIAGIDPRIIEYQQGLGRQPDETGETFIKKEDRDQTEPDDFATQATKLPERKSKHINEVGKQLDIGIDHKEFKGRSDDLSSMGR